MRRLWIGSCLLLALSLVPGRVLAGDAEEIAKLVAEIKEKGKDDFNTRILCSKLMGFALQNKTALDAMMEFVADPKVSPQATAVLLLMSGPQLDLGPAVKTAMPTLLKNLRDPAFEKSRSSLLSLIKKGRPEADKALLEVLEDILKNDANSRNAALEAVGALGPQAKSLAPVVLAILKEEYEKHKNDRFGGGLTLRVSLENLMKIDPDPKEALPVIEPLRTHRDEFMAKLATRAFLVIGKDPAEIAKVVDAKVAIWKDKKNRKRFDAFNDLKELGPVATGAIPAMLESLDDPRDGSQAMEFFNLIGPQAKETVIPALMKQLEKKDGWPRQFVPIYNLLLKLGVEEKKLLPAVIAVWEDYVSPDSKYPIQQENGRGQGFQIMGFALVQKLGRDAAPAAKILGQVAVHSWKTKRGTFDMLQDSLKSLKALGPDARPAAADLMEIAKLKGDPGLGFYGGLADEALKGIDNPVAVKPKDPVKPVDPMNPDKPPVVARPAADAALLQELGGKDEAAREKAVEKLVAQGAAAVPTLQEGLKADAMDVRVRAAGALGKLKGKAKEAVPALIEALKDRAPEVRREAAAALAALGPDARDAEAALTDLLQDSDREVRLLAAYALEKLQGK